jgi:hypothetical protein
LVQSNGLKVYVEQNLNSHRAYPSACLPHCGARLPAASIRQCRNDRVRIDAECWRCLCRLGPYIVIGSRRDRRRAAVRGDCTSGYGPTENGSNVCSDRRYSGMSGLGVWLEKRRNWARLAPHGSRRRFLCSPSSDEHPSERGVGSVGSRGLLEDLCADIRRSHVNDPAYRYMSPLAAGIPVDARERE